MLAGRALAGARPRVITPRAAGIAGAAAAAFPDSDIVLAAFGQFAYLELHQGLTHSLPMLPLWALFVAAVCALVYDRRPWHRRGGRRRLTLEFLPIAMAGIAVHIVGDLFNIWGLKLWWPFSDTRIAFEAVFVIDPLYSALVAVGLVASLAWRVRAGAVAGLALVAAYTAIAVGVHAHANAVVAGLSDARGAGAAFQHAAPPSLAHRRFVLRDDGGWRYAFADLRADAARPAGASWWSRFVASYRPLDDLEWHDALHPEDAGGFVLEAWERPGLAPFRAFVGLPVVHEVGRDGDAMCAWFSDLRFTLPEVTQAFVWGACRAGDAWEVRQRGRW